MKMITVLSLSISLLVVFLSLSTRGDSLRVIPFNVSISSNEQDTLQLNVRAVADGYLRNLDLTSWSMDLEQWISRHEYKGVVDTFHASDWMQWEFEKYCFRIRIENNQCTTEYSFFDNGDYSNPKAILQQVVVFDQRTKRHRELDQRVWDVVSDSLTKKYATPVAVPDDEMLSPFDLESNRDEFEPRLWQDSAKRIILGEHLRWKDTVRTDFITLLSREKALDSRVHQDQLIEQKYNNSSIFRGGALISEICDSLRMTRTPLALFCRPDGDLKNLLHDLVECGHFISNTNRLGDSGYLPLYLMALYLFGESYSPSGNGDGSGPWRDVDTLRHYNIVFEWSHLGEGWVYSKEPLIDIYTKYSGSRWGQLAFLMLQDAGWCLDEMCNENKGPEVVSKGQEFMSRYPKSIYAPGILLTIAKGYETNWNVSTSESESPYMYDVNNRSNEDSRVKAIAAYERILAAYPNSGEAEIAKLRLPRLKLGINTDRKDYFFIYD